MADERCVVCSEPLASDRATCYLCGSDYHLALRTDSQTRDCGEVWIDDEAQALAFACNACLGRVTVPGKRRYAKREGERASDVARARRGQGGRSKRS